ncbi:hypothetical protein B0H13DRAFT_2539917 [Mycena leptocephala]|nr:hypothetical protein B0H13DRAFT_2539917 [Mycena leptocephala]
MPSELIFVTGASGFLGSHVTLQLLEKGYRVRLAARGTKADHLKSSYASYGDRVEVVKITDISHDQFPEALVGVDAIIHLASPLPGRAEPAGMLAAAVEGTLNVIVQGERAGVKRLVVTSSIGTVINPKDSYTDQDWNPVTKEFALTGGVEMLTYAASKKFAELALWEWADKHPHVEVTTEPAFLLRPIHSALSSSHPRLRRHFDRRALYNYLFPDGVFPGNTRYIDVRDVAQAHVRALNTRPTAEVGRKRIILSSPFGWPFQQTVDFIAEQRPALKGRLITATPQVQPFDVLPMDFGRTTLDTVDALLQVEERGGVPGIPLRRRQPLTE